MMSLQAVCQDYLTSADKDGDLVLIALSEQLDSEDHGGVAVELLLQDEYKLLLTDLGWDLLTLITPQLLVKENHLYWSLVHRIVELGSPKEMCLAMLDQMDSLSSSEKTAAMFNMLKPLQKALLGAPNVGIVNSTLHSIYRLLQLHYPSLQLVGGQSDSMNSKPKSVDAEEDIEPLPQSIDAHTVLDKNEPIISYNTDSEDTLGHQCLDYFAVTERVLTFIKSFVDNIHSQATLPVNLFPRNIPMGNTLRSDPLREQKIECLAILFCLLDYPLVTCSLRADGVTKDTSSVTRARHCVALIMSQITHCHYGCLQLLSTPSHPHWPKVGVASFIYFLFMEENTQVVDTSYFPAMLSQQFIVSMCLGPVITLLERAESVVVLKGLALLEYALRKVKRNSLTLEVLEKSPYITVANVLTKVMVSCSNKAARQKSVSLLTSLVGVFLTEGCHKLLSSLLHTIGHAGVVRLLVHSIKNEVDAALKVPLSSEPHPFLGDSLGQLLRRIFTISPDTELMEELDRVMAALNFLRYLLIRDSQEENKTGVWTMPVQDTFLVPTRQLVTSTRIACRQELVAKREGKGERLKDTPEVTVQVSGERLPQLSDSEEQKMLALADSHLDMLESVLVRTEELVEQRT